jgi:hypothetical protein
MKPLFELPELLTLDGTSFMSEAAQANPGHACSGGCVGSCCSGCEPGSGGGKPLPKDPIG